MLRCTFTIRYVLPIVLLLLGQHRSDAFALLSHEAIIDESWEESILPLLEKKYPGATPDDLRKARAFMYGGAVMPDIGYTPFGSALFSNLVHYVRTGDFMHALLDEAQNLEEYAFALGFLCHYMADCYGHPLSTNKAVPKFFPKAKQKYGNDVTYEQCEKYHSRAEFSFDIFQVANGQYEPDDYRDFIGFEINKPVLERAFLKTYGIKLEDIFSRFAMSESLFRFAVRSIFPALTKASWRIKKSQLEKDGKPLTKKDYVYRVNRREYNEKHGKPGVKSMGLAFIIVILPKIGPLSALRFKVPDESVEALFNEGFSAIVKNYKQYLDGLRTGTANKLANLNWDTGERSEPGAYKLTDETYLELIQLLEKHNFEHLNPALKEDILAYYSDKSKIQCPPASKERKWKKLDSALEKLAKS